MKSVVDYKIVKKSEQVYYLILQTNQRIILFVGSYHQILK